MTDTRPILFFDSGVGGLSVLAPTRALLPRAPFVYVADSAGFPYGTEDRGRKSRGGVPALLGRLAERYRPRLIVIACNTASTIALAAVRSALDLPVVGTVPAIKPAAEQSRTRVIGVLGTDATVRQPDVDDLAGRFASDCVVLRHGSAELVALAEARLRGDTAPRERYAAILSGLFDQPGGERIDVIVNACTHFPLVVDELAAAAPHPVAFVDGSAGIARRVAHLTRDHSWPDEPGEGIAIFTGGADDRLAGALRNYGLSFWIEIALGDGLGGHDLGIALRQIDMNPARARILSAVGECPFLHRAARIIILLRIGAITLVHHEASCIRAAVSETGQARRRPG